MQFAWATIDAALLTVILTESEGVSSPLLLVYPLLVATSGFWVRVSLVVFMTALALLSYGIVALDTALRRPDLMVTPDKHLIFVTVVLVAGLIVGRNRRGRCRHFGGQGSRPDRDCS